MIRWLLVLVALSGCVQRVVRPPAALEPPPPGTPANAVGISFEGDRADGRSWDVLAGQQPACPLPCSLWLDPAESVQLRSSRGEGLFLDSLRDDLQGATRGVVVAEGVSAGKRVNGIVFTTLGAMGSVVAITLTAVGCSDVSRRGGLCTAGLITGLVNLPLMAVSIWMVADSGPKAHVFPVFDAAPKQEGVSLLVTPAGVAGRF